MAGRIADRTLRKQDLPSRYHPRGHQEGPWTQCSDRVHPHKTPQIPGYLANQRVPQQANLKAIRL